jgi:hypothetical protein
MRRAKSGLRSTIVLIFECILLIETQCVEEDVVKGFPQWPVTNVLQRQFVLVNNRS